MSTIKSIFIQAIVFIIGLFLFFIFKNFWPKYFEAKGINQATKEDIGEITEIVESIKTDLLKRTEELKAELSLSNQHRLNLKTAEREAIFDYNRKLSAWIYYLVRFRLSTYNFYNYKELKKEEQKLSKLKYECDLAENQLVLFMHDKEFLEIKRDLTVSIIKYEGILEKAMQEVYHLHLKSELDIEIAEQKDKSKIKGSMYEQLKFLLEKHHEETLKQYKIINDYHIKFRDIINNRLSKILEV
jgi:hypothetical protein